MVMKFTFQSVLVTLAKIQDTPARNAARSRSSCIISFDLIGQGQNKRFYVTEIVFVGREARTGNMSAVHWLRTGQYQYN